MKSDDNPVPAKPPTIKALPTEPSMPIRVSIVEDDSASGQILSATISRTPGFQFVSRFTDAESALAALPDEKPDVVLMDINLPGLSGVECVRQLRPRLPGTQFVMVTVYEDSDHIFNALAAGAAGYLLKQTPRGELIAAIQDVHRGGSPMTSNIARKVVQSFQQGGPSPREMENLSHREQEVLDLLARGFLYKEIAESLGLSVPTVNTYIRRIYEKLQVRSRGQAVAKYLNQGGAPEWPQRGV
jgi:DNA-binding NarL/FixJ family response regulator